MKLSGVTVSETQKKNYAAAPEVFHCFACLFQIKQSENHRAATTQSLYAGPRRQIVMQCTEQVTEGIKQLWRCIQGTNREESAQCADRIKIAVTNLTTAIANVRLKSVTYDDLSSP